MSEKAKKLKVALAGNPNSGKTTIFNCLTGLRQHVGNYPGVTVEKVEGYRSYRGVEFDITDLPGTYSLSAYSVEELIARNFIIHQKPDVVVVVVDCANLERNLYLAVQLVELDIPMVLAFNMADIAKRKGLIFDIEKLSQLFGVRIVQTIGNKAEGIEKLLDAVIETSTEGKPELFSRIKYGDEINAALDKITAQLKAADIDSDFDNRYLALKLLEQDPDITKHFCTANISETVEKSIAYLRSIFGQEPEVIIADRRYGFVSGAATECIKNTIELRHNRSDIIDTVVTHKIFGLPIFVAMMYLVFDITFRLGAYPMAGLEYLFGGLSNLITNLWPDGRFELLQSLIVDGVIGGVGGVVIFLPNIILLFMAIAILEDTGYMARAAFVADRLMHKIGLHGKSFIPMLIGFGCTIPAIMACRILENRRNRLTTILVLPLFSCGARITIYSLFIPAFFALRWRGAMMFLVYFIGIVIAVVAAKVLRLTLLKGETTPFVMELPPYRVPTFRSILIHMFERSWMYLKKAGTIILFISIVLWFAGNFPRPDGSAESLGVSESSVMGRVSSFVEPVFKPLGFDRRVVTAMTGALAAKEVFVSQMAITYSVDEHADVSELRDNLRNDYTSLQAFCIMLFCLISAPCVATVAITRAETGKWRWAILQWGGLTALAYIIVLIVYQIGSLF